MVHNTTKNSLPENFNSGLKVLVFHASWCGACKMLSPVLDRLAQEDSYEVFKVNIDEDKAFAKELGVSSIPSVFVYKNGQVVANWVGYQPYEVMKKKSWGFKIN